MPAAQVHFIAASLTPLAFRVFASTHHAAFPTAHRIGPALYARRGVGRKPAKNEPEIQKTGIVAIGSLT